MIVSQILGMTAILVQQMQGPQGSGGLAINGTGFAHVTAGTIDGTARAVNLASADVSGLLPVASLSTGTNGFVLTMVGGVPTWAAASAAGITQLTSDVTAGPGSGSQVATVVAIHGASVPVAGALTTGNVLQVTGVSALGYGPVNLAGGAGFVTGVLPMGNMAAPTGTGFGYVVSGAWNAAAVGIATDVAAGALSGGSVPLTVVQITGSAGVCTVVNATNLGFATTGATLSTNGRLNFGHNLAQNILSQRNQANTADDAIISVNGNDKIFGSFSYGNSTLYGTTQVVIGNAGFNGVLLNSSTLTLGSSSLTVVMGGSAGWFLQSSVPALTLGSTSADLGGASGGVLDLAPLTTSSTALPATHVGLYNSAGQILQVNANGISFSRWAVSPQIFQIALASTSAGSGAAGNELDVISQPGQAATGATNAGGNSGVFLARSGFGGSSALAAGGNSGIAYFGTGAGGAATAGTGNGGNSGDAILYTGGGGTSAGGAAGTVGVIRFRVGSQTNTANDVAYVEANGARLWNATAGDFGGGVQVLSLGASGTTTPTALPANGCGLFCPSGTSALGLNASGITVPSGVGGTFAIQQTAKGSVAGAGVNGTPWTLTSQLGQAATGAANNGGGGGGLTITAGAGGSSALSTGGAGGALTLAAGAGGTGPTGGAGALASLVGGAGSTGGNAFLGGGAGGTGANGLARMGSAGVVYLSIGAAGLDMSNTTQSISTSGNTNVAAGALYSPIIRINSVTLVGAASITFPNSQGTWFVDISQIAAINLGLTFKSGTATSASVTALGDSMLVMVCTYGSNTISINQ